MKVTDTLIFTLPEQLHVSRDLTIFDDVTGDYYHIIYIHKIKFIVPVYRLIHIYMTILIIQLVWFIIQQLNITMNH